MSLTELEKLKFYMKPYYQEASDQGILTNFLGEFITANCAAAELWELKAAELGGSSDGGIKQLKNASESTTFNSSKESQETAEANAEKFKLRCQEEDGSSTGFGAFADKGKVAGVTELDTGYDGYIS